MSKQEVREAIAQMFCPPGCDDYMICGTPCESVLNQADALLARKHPNGQPMLGVICEEQPDQQEMIYVDYQGEQTIVIDTYLLQQYGWRKMVMED